ncbi:MAG: RICIN domain-containing protein, partial [Phascolarctobacterium sp.]|nr:RICIN domain-containing protein [Candidatus Phascolarctobacterium equi]
MKIFRAVVVTLVAVIIMCIGLFVHAAPPVGKTVLQTYSCKRVNDCYTGIGTGKTGWIAAHDDLIRLYEIRSDGWVKGDYPAGSGRVTRWFKFGDLVMNGNFQNYEANLVNAKTLPVYRTHNSSSSFGTVYNTDKVIVVDEYGSRKCIVYNLDAGGYKMGWVDKNKVARENNPISLQPTYPAVGWYYLKSVWKPGYVIAVDGSNVCVQKQTDANMQANMDKRGIKSNQKWYLSKNGNSYLLKNEATNRYMNLSGTGFGNEKNINAVTTANSRSLFNFFTYKGYYFLQPNGGGNYILDLYGGNNMAYNNNIQIYGANGGVNQAWELVKVTNPSPQPQPKPQPVNLQDAVAER